MYDGSEITSGTKWTEGDEGEDCGSTQGGASSSLRQLQIRAANGIEYGGPGHGRNRDVLREALQTSRGVQVGVYTVSEYGNYPLGALAIRARCGAAGNKVGAQVA